jgi:hypothetical protein
MRCSSEPGRPIAGWAQDEPEKNSRTFAAATAEAKRRRITLLPPPAEPLALQVPPVLPGPLQAPPVLPARHQESPALPELQVRPEPGPVLRVRPVRAPPG